MSMRVRPWRGVRALALVVLVAGCDSMPGALTEPDAAGAGGGPGSQTQATLVVLNGTAVRISEVYFSPCSSDTWGSNRLGSQTIAPQQSRSWAVPSGCLDIKVRFSGAGESSPTRADIPAGSSYTVTFSGG